MRALDRVLISGGYVVPLFYLAEQWVARRAPVRHAARTSLFAFSPTAGGVRRDRRADNRRGSSGFLRLCYRPLSSTWQDRRRYFRNSSSAPKPDPKAQPKPNGAARSFAVLPITRRASRRCFARGRRLSDRRGALGGRARRLQARPPQAVVPGRALPCTRQRACPSLSTSAEQDTDLFVPVIARTRDDAASGLPPSSADALTIAAKAPAERLVRRLTAALRVRPCTARCCGACARSPRAARNCRSCRTPIRSTKRAYWSPAAPLLSGPVHGHRRARRRHWRAHGRRRGVGTQGARRRRHDHR